MEPVVYSPKTSIVLNYDRTMYNTKHISGNKNTICQKFSKNLGISTIDKMARLKNILYFTRT